MTTPEKALARRRRQIFDGDTMEPRELHTPEHEDIRVRGFIARLARLIRNVGGKK